MIALRFAPLPQQPLQGNFIFKKRSYLHLLCVVLCSCQICISSFAISMLTPAALSDANDIWALQAACASLGLSPSPEEIQGRINEANEFFWTFRKSDESELVGFVIGTCVRTEMNHCEIICQHEAGECTLVIQSVIINPDQRRKGLGSQMVQCYIDKMVTNRNIDKILLLSKSDMLIFWIACGFKLIGLSDVAHDQDKWFKMGLDLVELRSVEQIQVDAFAEVPFSGNPAAVIFEHRDDVWMQNVAMENNVAATVFLSLITDKIHAYAIRWFTPSKEIELCGHGTLAAAHVLYESRRVPNFQSIQFHTLYNGVLSAQGRPDGTIEMHFPLISVSALPSFPTERRFNLATALAVCNDEILFIGISNAKLVVEVTRFAFARLATTNINYDLLAEQGGRGVLVTAQGGARAEAVDLKSLCLDSAAVGVRTPRADVVNDSCFDFVSRCFLPQCGVNEDPVTGSAHCSLAPYWAAKLLTVEEQEQGKTLVAYQASARGGVLQLNVKGDRVVIAGPAVTTMRARIIV